MKGGETGPTHFWEKAQKLIFCVWKSELNYLLKKQNFIIENVDRSE